VVHRNGTVLGIAHESQGAVDAVVTIHTLESLGAGIDNDTGCDSLGIGLERIGWADPRQSEGVLRMVTGISTGRVISATSIALQMPTTRMVIDHAGGETCAVLIDPLPAIGVGIRHEVHIHRAISRDMRLGKSLNLLLGQQVVEVLGQILTSLGANLTTFQQMAWSGVVGDLCGVFGTGVEEVHGRRVDRNAERTKISEGKLVTRQTPVSRLRCALVRIVLTAWGR